MSCVSIRFTQYPMIEPNISIPVVGKWKRRSRCDQKIYILSYFLSLFRSKYSVKLSTFLSTLLRASLKVILIYICKSNCKI